jgi:hypothetical protein
MAMLEKPWKAFPTNHEYGKIPQNWRRKRSFDIHPDDISHEIHLNTYFHLDSLPGIMTI